MKTTKIILILGFLPFWSIGQVKSTIDFIGGIEYSNRTLSTSSEEEVIISIFEGRQGERGKFNFRFGLNYNKRLTNRVWLKSGLRLASIGYEKEKIAGLVYQSEFDPITGEFAPDPNLPHEIQLLKDYWYLEIPLLIRIESNEKKIRPFIEVGISPHIYLTTRSKRITDIDQSSMFQRDGILNFNHINLAGIISFGGNYDLSDTLIVFVQPIFRYHFSRIVDAPISEHLYNFGIELGLRKGIN